jgi:hypothetical protein
LNDHCESKRVDSEAGWVGYSLGLGGAPDVIVRAYGNTYQPQTCNGTDVGLGTMANVGTMPGCESSVSGYSGVYDLGGDVSEW